MSLQFEVRPSESPYVDSITHGWTDGEGSTVRPAESHWHWVMVKQGDKLRAIVTGALTTAGVVSWGSEAEILWIKFKLGTYLSPLPGVRLVNKETPLPDASSRSFWLHGSAWQVPTHENVDTFIARLVREDILRHDPIVASALNGEARAVSPRTLRHRFLHATGLSHNDVHQIERAKRAAALLAQGVSILDTVHDVGYYDQPHLTRSLKRWVGHTPAKLLAAGDS
jgi:AraC-like DNA-binding protein